MNKKVRIILLSVIAFLILSLTTTYGLWYVTRNQTNSNIIATKCLDISLNNEENDITLTEAYPITDEEGLKLTPYTFTVTNNCNTSIDYLLNLELLGDSASSVTSSAIKVSLNDNTTLLSNKETRETTIENAYKSYQLMYGRLNTNESEDYSLRLWVDENAQVNESNKVFESKISIIAGQGIENPFEEGTLAHSIIGNAGGSKFITTVSDFGVVTTENYAKLHKAEDDFGTSYYYRGAPTNNYVKFGTWNEELTEVWGYYSTDRTDGYEVHESLESCNADSYANNNCTEVTLANKGDDMYWRIVRINGDGTIRMIYDGTEAVANGTTHIARIGETAYNTNYDNAKYVGYTYEGEDGTQTDSTIKTYLDNWYNTNLKTNYGTYIADSGFCNDRTSRVEKGYTYYGAYDRLYTDKAPQLKCNQTTDNYTINTEYGNGYLQYPVGLITADEIAMAGGVAYNYNPTFYLANGDGWYSTFSPKGFSYGYAYVWSFLYGHSLNSSSVSYADGGARPVINLKADVMFEGSGTIDDPFRLAS